MVQYPLVMNTIQIIATIIFAIGYLGIIFEYRSNLNKSAFAIITGGFLWILLALNTIFVHGDVTFLTNAISASASEIFDLLIFLICAMTLVEILVRYQFFDLIRGLIYKLNLSDRKQFFLLIIITFILSAFVPNLTITIVMVTIARKFFKGENFLVTVLAIVLASNAGGIFSPIGDVTNTMLWMAGKYSAGQIITMGFLPALSIVTVSTILLSLKLKNDPIEHINDLVYKLTRTEIVVVVSAIFSFVLTFVMNALNLPPYLGLLIGLGIVWLEIDLFKQLSKRETHIEADIKNVFKSTDIASLQFFIGVLLAVSALEHFGVLQFIANILYGTDFTNTARVIVGNVGLGLVSAIFNTIPLTAIAIKTLQATDPALWVLLEITICSGGSLLVIGSSAGVIAMGLVKELTFDKYVKYAFIPAFLAFVAGIVVWYVQSLVI